MTSADIRRQLDRLADHIDSFDESDDTILNTMAHLHATLGEMPICNGHRINLTELECSVASLSESPTRDQAEDLVGAVCYHFRMAKMLTELLTSELRQAKRAIAMARRDPAIRYEPGRRE